MIVITKAIRMLSSYPVSFQVTTRLLSMIDLSLNLRNIVDLPCLPGFNSSLDGGDCLHGSHYTDELAATYLQLNKQK